MVGDHGCLVAKVLSADFEDLMYGTVGYINPHYQAFALIWTPMAVSQLELPSYSFGWYA